MYNVAMTIISNKRKRKARKIVNAQMYALFECRARAIHSLLPTADPELAKRHVHRRYRKERKDALKIDNLMTTDIPYKPQRPAKKHGHRERLVKLSIDEVRDMVDQVQGKRGKPRGT